MTVASETMWTLSDPLASNPHNSLRLIESRLLPWRFGMNLGPTQSLQVTRRTWAISLPIVYAWSLGSGSRLGARNTPQRSARRVQLATGAVAPCSPYSSKIHGVGARLSPGT